MIANMKNSAVATRLEIFVRKLDIQGNILCKDGHDKDRNGKDLTEAEEIKRWQEYTEELYKKKRS